MGINMKKNIIIYGVFLFFVLFSITACTKKQEFIEQESQLSFFSMDTSISLTAYGENAEIALKKVKQQIQDLEKLWSVTEEESEIYKINHSNGKEIEVSKETTEILTFALQMAEQTEGALEPSIYPVVSAWGFTTEEKRVPLKEEITNLLTYVGYKRIRLSGNNVQLETGMQLDLGSLGKGYAGDKAVEILKKCGITSALLDIGGNIQIIGRKPDGQDWRLGVRSPFYGDILGIIELSDCAVITSGSYERYFVDKDGIIYGHIINPQTGYPVENDLASVTIIASQGKQCDALSTALFVMGLDKAIEYWRKNEGFEAILVTKEQGIYITEGIKKKFTLKQAYDYLKVYEVNR